MGSRKLQINAMNQALKLYATDLCKKENVRSAKKTKILQNLKYNEPIFNMEVYQTNSIYDSANREAIKIKTDIMRQESEE